MDQFDLWNIGLSYFHCHYVLGLEKRCVNEIAIQLYGGGKYLYLCVAGIGMSASNIYTFMTIQVSVSSTYMYVHEHSICIWYLYVQMSNVGLVEVTKSAHNLSNGNSCLSFTHRISRREELKHIHTRDPAGSIRRPVYAHVHYLYFPQKELRTFCTCT